MFTVSTKKIRERENQPPNLTQAVVLARTIQVTFEKLIVHSWHKSNFSFPRNCRLKYHLSMNKMVSMKILRESYAHGRPSWWGTGQSQIHTTYWLPRLELHPQVPNKASRWPGWIGLSILRSRVGSKPLGTILNFLLPWFSWLHSIDYSTLIVVTNISQKWPS